MCSEDQDIERNEAYAEGRMSGAERDAFEQRLRTDPPLVEQLARYRETREGVVRCVHERERAM
ncbi:MAG: hypothetical protein IPI81_11465 [Flavobacteriales bacterium]|nr:hypothetical protein [Flavobacteriales bacterium]